MLASTDFVVWSKDLTLDDKKEVGIKLASIGELASHDIDILPSVVITPNTLHTYFTGNNLSIKVKHLLGTLNHERHDSLSQVSSYISNLIQKGVFPEKIAKNIFSFSQKLHSNKLTLYASYFQGSKQVGVNKWADISGESVLIDSIRVAWSDLFSPQNLKKHTMHENNHKEFSVCLSVIPQYTYSLTGTIKTCGRTKSEYEIEAHSMVKFIYNKNARQLLEGTILPGGKKDALMPAEIKGLLSIAHKAEKALYLPQVLSWGKYKDKFLINNVTPLSDEISYNDTYSTLTKNLSVHPGITIGRLKVINERDKEALLIKDEIIMLKKLDRAMVSALKKAKGIILEEEPDAEITFMLKNFGIPTIIRKKHHMLYSTGDVISLNATTGEIKRGSMLVS